MARADPATILAAAARAKLDVVEIPLLRPDEIDIETTVALTREHGVAVTCSLGLPKQVALPAYPQKARKFLINALDSDNYSHRLAALIVLRNYKLLLGSLNPEPTILCSTHWMRARPC